MTKQELLDAISNIAELIGKKKNYDLMIRHSSISIPKIIELIVYDMFLYDLFSRIHDHSNEIIKSYRLIYEYADVMNNRGYFIFN